MSELAVPSHLTSLGTLVRRGGRIRTVDLQLMRLAGTTELPHSALVDRDGYSPWPAERLYLSIEGSPVAVRSSKHRRIVAPRYPGVAGCASSCQM